MCWGACAHQQGYWRPRGYTYNVLLCDFVNRSWSKRAHLELILTNPSEIEMSEKEGTNQLSEEVIQAVEERILKKLQGQLGAQHKVKEGGR